MEPLEKSIIDEIVSNIISAAIEVINEKDSIQLYDEEGVIDRVKSKTKSKSSLCTCNGCVICSNALEKEVTVHIKDEEGQIYLGDLKELNKSNIELEKSFEGCIRSDDNKCHIYENNQEWIEDKEWQNVDDLSSQGTGKEVLEKDKSYMICNAYGGVIYFKSDGQEIKPLINGEIIFRLSNEYMQWLILAEGCTLYPYRDKKDNTDMQSKKNVTLGIGFTFDNTGRNWDILKKVLGWTDKDINSIINGVYWGNTYENTQYTITQDQALEMFHIVAESTYIPNLNAAIQAYNIQTGGSTSYSQRELEAMFDYSYNNGLSPDKGQTYSSSINDPDKIIFYYLRKDLPNAVNAVKKWGSDDRRRLNQMNLFFNDYSFLDKKGTGLNPLRKKLGF